MSEPAESVTELEFALARRRRTRRQQPRIAPQLGPAATVESIEIPEFAPALVEVPFEVK